MGRTVKKKRPRVKSLPRAKNVQPADFYGKADFSNAGLIELPFTSRKLPFADGEMVDWPDRITHDLNGPIEPLPVLGVLSPTPDDPLHVEPKADWDKKHPFPFQPAGVSVDTAVGVELLHDLDRTAPLYKDNPSALADFARKVGEDLKKELVDKIDRDVQDFLERSKHDSRSRKQSS